MQFVDLGLAEDSDQHVNDSFVLIRIQLDTRCRIMKLNVVSVRRLVVTYVIYIQRSGETRAARTADYGSTALSTASRAALGPTQLPVPRTSGNLSRG